MNCGYTTNRAWGSRAAESCLFASNVVVRLKTVFENVVLEVVGIHDENWV